ncbi:MAG: long-chain fatty acid--CoA ligase, partial [Acidobacteria bacterium]|nr:long-chain fatty acid--CoA ligase [Acidobacteriota bacterium]
ERSHPQALARPRKGDSDQIRHGSEALVYTVGVRETQNGNPGYNLKSLRRVCYGGSPMAPEIIRRFREKFPGVELVQGYGMTETAPLLTALLDHEHEGERLLSCGRAIQGVELRVADELGRDVPVRERGEVVARGWNVMKGYWNKPKETAEAFFEGGWLRTGDIAWRDEEGFFYIVDRRKDMIITGGENVYSTEVEVAVYSHPSVREAAVIGIPDAQWGEVVCACVALKDGAVLTPEELREHCRSKLANYKVPKRVEIIPGELPKSGTNKILKRELRERFWDGTSRGVN